MLSEHLELYVSSTCTIYFCVFPLGLPDGLVSKESAYNAGAAGGRGSIPKSEMIPWRREWQPT